MKEFNGYIETNQWLKKLMDELNEEDGMRLEDAFYAFKQHCTKVENLPIPDVIGIPILAKIEYINDLGKSKWYEVVYYDDGWYSYAGSKTFQDGEQVVEWKYCRDCL